MGLVAVLRTALGSGLFDNVKTTFFVCSWCALVSVFSFHLKKKNELVSCFLPLFQLGHGEVN
jgi:hypothetical protein